MLPFEDVRLYKSLLFLREQSLPHSNLGKCLVTRLCTAIWFASTSRVSTRSRCLRMLLDTLADSFTAKFLLAASFLQESFLLKNRFWAIRLRTFLSLLPENLLRSGNKVIEKCCQQSGGFGKIKLAIVL